MLESIINLVSSGAVDSHTPQTAVAAVLCAAMIGCLAEARCLRRMRRKS
ncbi:hypothetical protein [Escherichia coli ISC41]|nr:YshB family small membrane protein [Escherichia coli]CDL49675.1 hypothetical protein [Escherichia coli ISC41]